MAMRAIPQIRFSNKGSLKGVQIGSLVHRFITSGKKGSCELCHSIVEKLEAHHIKYAPEATINLCHSCHHRVHFWPLRVTEEEKFKILSKVYPAAKALELSKFAYADVTELAKIIAPSRKKFIHEAQKLDEIAFEFPKNSPDNIRAILQIRRLNKKQQEKNPIRVLAGIEAARARLQSKDINTRSSLLKSTG
jgi:hypothetical protein